MLRTVSDAVGAAHASTEPYMVTAACPPHAITYANPAWLELFGWSAAELARQTVKILHGPQTSRKELAALEVALASKQPACAQLTLYDRHGETTACTVIAEPLLDPSRQLVTHHAHLIRSAVATAAQSSAASLAAAQAQAQAQTDAHAHARAMATAAAVSDSWRLGAAFAASDAATDAILGAELDRLLPTILTGGGSGECSDGGGGHELIRPSSFASMLGANAAIELAGGLSAWLNAADVAPAPSGGASPAAPPSASAARAHGGGGGGSGLGRLGAFGGQLASSSQQQLEEHTRLQLLQRQLEASMHASETSAEPRPLFKVIVNVDSSVFRMPLTLEAALQPSADMIVVTEALPPYRIVHVNSAWSRTCGWTAEQAVGQTCRILQGAGTCRVALRKLDEAVMAGGSLTVQLLNYTAEGRPFMNSMCVMPLRQPAQPGGGPAALDASFARPWHYVGVCKALPLDLAAASRAIALVADKTAVGGGGGGASAIGCGGAHGAHGGGGALGGLTLDEMGAGTHRASAYGERPVPAGTAAAVGGAIKPRVAPFISKLFKMVSAPETDDCIRWSADRASFMIADTGRFEQEVLPAYFRHNRFASFSQQLHTYNFAQKSSLSCLDPRLEYAHDLFTYANAERLHEIKRGALPPPSASGAQTTTLESAAASGGAASCARAGAKRARIETTDVSQVQEIIQQHRTHIHNIDTQFSMAHRSIRALMMQICDKLVQRCYLANGSQPLGGKYAGLVAALQEMHAEVAPSALGAATSMLAEPTLKLGGGGGFSGGWSQPA